MYTKNNTPWVNGPTNSINASVLNTYEEGISNLYVWATTTTANNGVVLTTSQRKVFVNTTNGAYGLTLPVSPAMGDEVTFVDVAGTFTLNNFTITPSAGNAIMGVVDDTLILSTDHDFVTLTYSGATYGWVITKKP